MRKVRSNLIPGGDAQAINILLGASQQAFSDVTAGFGDGSGDTIAWATWTTLRHAIKHLEAH